MSFLGLPSFATLKSNFVFMYLIDNILGCTFEDVEFIGGDLSKAQGGGGVKIPYDDECIIACENNNRCKYVAIT